MTTLIADVPVESKNTGYSLLQISLHWIIATLVISQLYFGESMTHAFDAAAEATTASAFDTQFASLHYWFGIAILALVGVRLIVRITQGVPPAAVSTPRWSDLAARIAHGLFYFLLVAVPVTGLLGYYVEGPFGDIHAWAKPVFMGLISIHGLAALYQHFWVKDGTLSRMLKPQS